MEQMLKYNLFEFIVQNILENQREKVHDITNYRKINYGISQNTYDKYYKENYLKIGVKECDIPKAKDVEELQIDEVIIFYYQLYIKNHVYKIEDPNTSYLYFDTLVNLGCKNATLIIQKACNIEKDGVFGKNTISTINRMNQKDLQNQLIEQRIDFLNDAKKKCLQKFQQYENWISSLNQLKEQIDKGIIPKQDTQQSQNKNNFIKITNEIELEKKIVGINFKLMKFLINVQEDIHLADLATVLLVLGDLNISKEEQIIKFKLVPVLSLNNQDIQQQNKQFWPQVKREIIQDTEFGKVMFESSHLLQQISLGISADGKTPFKYPKELELCGLKPYQNFGNMDENQFIYKFILYPQNCVFRILDDQFLIEGIQIKCKAKYVEIKEQQIVEKEINDKNDSGLQFAEKFNVIYDKISKYYPIFKRLQKLFKAVVLGKQMMDKNENVKADADLLNQSTLKSQNLPLTIQILKCDLQRKNIQQINSNQGKQLQKFVLVEVDTSCKAITEQKEILNKVKFTNITEIDIPFFLSQKCNTCNRMIESQLLNLGYNDCSIHHSDSCYKCLNLTEKEDQILYNIGKTQYKFHKNCYEVYEKIKTSKFDFDFQIDL